MGKRRHIRPIRLVFAYVPKRLAPIIVALDRDLRAEHAAALEAMVA
jgi:hypothetical protein